MTLNINFPREEQLAQDVVSVCHSKGWALDWSRRGCYLHLEASELIEALRGKQGDPLSEAADVLIVLMSITKGILNCKWEDVVTTAEETISRLKQPKENNECNLGSGCCGGNTGTSARAKLGREACCRDQSDPQ